MWNLKSFEAVYIRYQSSGLRVKDFCRNECISVSRFFYWQKKFRQHHRELEQSSGFVPLVFNPSSLAAKVPIDILSGHHQAKLTTPASWFIPME